MPKTPKYNSPKIPWAKDRQSKLKTIEATYNFTPKYTALIGDEKIGQIENFQEQYNAKKDELVALKLKLVAAEKETNDYFVGVLKYVEAHYGGNSQEFEKAGGTPKSKRKSPLKALINNKLAKEAKRV